MLEITEERIWSESVSNLKIEIKSFMTFNYLETLYITTLLLNQRGADGNFPCPTSCNVVQCPHALECNIERTGFPFELEKKLGSGGFATVWKERRRLDYNHTISTLNSNLKKQGKYHDGHAAFKFVPLIEEEL